LYLRSTEAKRCYRLSGLLVLIFIADLQREDRVSSKEREYHPASAPTNSDDALAFVQLRAELGQFASASPSSLNLSRGRWFAAESVLSSTNPLSSGQLLRDSSLSATNGQLCRDESRHTAVHKILNSPPSVMRLDTKSRNEAIFGRPLVPPFSAPWRSRLARTVSTRNREAFIARLA